MCKDVLWPVMRRFLKSVRSLSIGLGALHRSADGIALSTMPKMEGLG